MTKALSLIGHKFIGLLDRLNDRFTSYRLMLYFLGVLIAWAVVGSFFNQVPFSWDQILVSTGWLLLVCWTTNKLLAKARFYCQRRGRRGGYRLQIHHHAAQGPHF
jgi:hypothetical protein